MSELVRYEDATVRFGDVFALSGASFTVPQGSVTTILGPNGAGKTTALKLALNLVKPSGGSVEVLGTKSRRLGPKQLQRIAYVAEGMEMPWWMTVEQLLSWCRPLYPEWDRQLERKLAVMFKVPEDRPLKSLSRGQRMKAALLSTLSYRPELLVLDEPFSGLDPVVRDDLTRSMLELAESECWGVMISTHDIAEVEQLADRVVVLKSGKVELEGDREALLEQWRRVEVLVPDGWEAPESYPREWLGVERMGNVLRFLESAYVEGGFGDKMARHAAGAYDPAVERIGLRDMLVALVKAGQVEVGA